MRTDDPKAAIAAERAEHKIRNDRRPRIGALRAPTDNPVEHILKLVRALAVAATVMPLNLPGCVLAGNGEMRDILLHLDEAQFN